LGSLLALAFTVHADPVASARVQVEVAGCSEALAPARLSDALSVELKNLDPELVAYIDTTNPRVTIQCRPGGDTSEIVVHVVTDRGEALQEKMQSNEIGAARFIAIAIAESLYAQASAPVEPPPPPPRTEPKPEPVVPTPPPRTAGFIRLMIRAGGMMWRLRSSAWIRAAFVPNVFSRKRASSARSVTRTSSRFLTMPPSSGWALW
jgi:hypothetical protein